MLRRYSWLAAVVIVVGGLTLLPVSLLPVAVARAAAWAPWATPAASASFGPDLHRSHIARVSRRRGREVPDSAGLASCEDKVEHGAGGGRPRVAIVGASFTAGVGPGNPLKSWAVLLARQLHWDAVVYGDPGAGYVRLGAGRKGPMAVEIARIGLRALQPALVIVQAGHDDIGVPAQLEQRRVEQVVDTIRAEAPHARIALLTVFTSRGRTAAADRTDRAIVTAGQAADRHVIIMDPLAGSWVFQRAHHGLHPSTSGDAAIERQVDEILRDHGVRAAAAGHGALICAAGIPVPPRPR